MYCGSCMRDNALAGSLKAAGHDVVLVPVYTPTLTDEANHSLNRVFFGGVSVSSFRFGAGAVPDPAGLPGR